MTPEEAAAAIVAGINGSRLGELCTQLLDQREAEADLTMEPTEYELLQMLGPVLNELGQVRRKHGSALDKFYALASIVLTDRRRAREAAGG